MVFQNFLFFCWYIKIIPSVEKNIWPRREVNLGRLGRRRRHYFLTRILWGGVHTGSTRQIGYFWPVVHAPGDCEDGGFGGMKIGRGNRSTGRKPAPAPLRPPQIPLDHTRAAAVGSQRLTAWAMARPRQRHYIEWLGHSHCLSEMVEHETETFS
jgi:hypothetical protein